jgi:K+-sensing histidine kinase KdpD
MVENERMKNLLTGTLVHDIKNFVMCIHGGLQFLETNTAGDPRNSRFVQMGLTACGDITSLASNLMDIQKIEEGKMPLNVEEVDVSAVCELIEKFRENPIFIERELMVITIPPIDRSPMWADMYLLKRVVHNIMSNAGKYAPKAGEVILNFEDGTQEQVISIFSSGEAIEDKYKEILFDKYSQMGQERSQYSKGLGLFFCKTVMLAHGGRIWVESDARGNYFKMAFPRQNSPCSKKPIEKQKAAEQPVPATPQQEPKVETKV